MKGKVADEATPNEPPAWDAAFHAGDENGGTKRSGAQQERSRHDEDAHRVSFQQLVPEGYTGERVDLFPLRCLVLSVRCLAPPTVALPVGTLLGLFRWRP